MIKTFYLALSYLLIATDVVRCKPDYLFNNLAGGWLKLHTIPATWQDAFLRCHYEGAVLASPLDKQLTDALHTLVTQSDMHGKMFLGTHDLFSKGDFVSVEGVPLSDMQITWAPSPRPSDADCLTMIAGETSSLIYFSSCTNSLPYICYRKLDNLTMNECGTFDNEYHLNQRTGSCYKVHQEKQTWSSAYRICASEGGYLVILNDREEARIVKDMFPVRAGEVNLWEQFHIGVLAWGDDRFWTTIHGERIEDVFHDWNPGQPDNYNGDQDHATLIRAGTMDDGSPSTRAMFVCEKSPDSIRFEESPLAIDESGLALHRQLSRVSIKRDWACSRKALYKTANEIVSYDGQPIEDVFNVWDEGQPDNLWGGQTRATFRRLHGALDDIPAATGKLLETNSVQTALQITC